MPFGIRATANRYGVEGFHLKDVLGVVAVARPAALTTRMMPVDVETAGELTRGMAVIDARPDTPAPANVQLATGVDGHAVREYIGSVLGRSV